MGDLRPVVDRHQSARGVEAMHAGTHRVLDLLRRHRHPARDDAEPFPERDARYPRDSDPHLDFAGCGHKHLEGGRHVTLGDHATTVGYAGCCPAFGTVIRTTAATGQPDEPGVRDGDSHHRRHWTT